MSPIVLTLHILTVTCSLVYLRAGRESSLIPVPVSLIQPMKTSWKQVRKGRNRKQVFHINFFFLIEAMVCFPVSVRAGRESSLTPVPYYMDLAYENKLKTGKGKQKGKYMSLNVLFLHKQTVTCFPVSVRAGRESSLIPVPQLLINR